MQLAEKAYDEIVDLFARGTPPGVWFGFLTACVAYVLAALLLDTSRRQAAGIIRLALPTACAAFVLFAPNPVPVVPFNMGQYLYGPLGTTSVSTNDVLFFREGPTCNVLVTQRQDSLSLRVNGKVDASNGHVDVQTQLATAYFPRLFAPDARDVLVIGLGSGTTAGASLLFPKTRVTCCELERAVFEAAPLFSRTNHKPFDSPFFSMVFDDGRSYLQGTNQKFDLILSEPSNPWMDGVAGLYTVEYLQTAQSRLNQGGIYVQWVQTYQLAPQDYALIGADSGFVGIQVAETPTITTFSGCDPSERDFGRPIPAFPASYHIAYATLPGGRDVATY